MIVYVDLEHDRLRQSPVQWEQSLARRLKHKYRFEDISGEPCLIVRYHRISPALLHELKARAVLVSGCSTDFEHYHENDLAGLRAVFREAAWPTLGFCGGHQLLAQTYGARIDAMGPASTAPTRDGPNPFPEAGYTPGLKEEHGFMPVRVLAPHGLVEGLGAQPVVYESHYWEVKSPPDGFRVYAESGLCAIQIMAPLGEAQPLFGTQFHPEEYDEAHPDGRRLLVNFFRMAGLAAA